MHRTLKTAIFWPKTVKNAVAQEISHTLWEGLQGMLGPFEARFDPRSASKSPTFALLRARWAHFGPFWPQIGVPPKRPIVAPKNAKKWFLPKMFLDPFAR